MNEKTKQYRLKAFLAKEDFLLKYRKNLRADFCHSQSITARNGVCQVCHKGVSLKDKKKMGLWDHGYRFAKIENKRHRKEKRHPQYFTGNICSECFGLVEKALDISIPKDYAP